jgi:hypothetical protein
MKTLNLFFISIAVAALLAGCGNKSGSSPQGTNAVNRATNGFGGYVNSLGQAQKNMTKTIDVSYLNEAIQQFNVQEGHYPKTLQELTPNYVAKLPTPPYGYKLDYDANSGTVKVVSQ